MVHRLLRQLKVWMLGPLARAGYLVLDADARLALAPRAQPAPQEPPAIEAVPARQVERLRVIEGCKAHVRFVEPAPGRPGIPAPAVAANAASR